jgi:hypothetical protein
LLWADNLLFEVLDAAFPASIAAIPAMQLFTSPTDVCHLLYRPSAAGTLTPLTPTRSSIQPAAAPLLMNDREMIGRRLAHAFPWNATAQVHLAMALRRREAYVSSGAASIKLQCGWQVSEGGVQEPVCKLTRDAVAECPFGL